VSKTALDDQELWCLLGLMNSLAANFLVRARVMTHVTAATMAALPMPRPQSGSAICTELASLSKSIGRAGMANATREYARLNALAAAAYGLTVDQFEYVAGTFPLIDAGVRRQARHELASLHRTVLPGLQ
jgi:hypothetical protein